MAAPVGMCQSNFFTEISRFCATMPPKKKQNLKYKKAKRSPVTLTASALREMFSSALGKESKKNLKNICDKPTIGIPTTLVCALCRACVKSHASFVLGHKYGIFSTLE